MRTSATLLVMLAAACISQAQLKVENRDHLVVPSERPQIIYATACRVVREEFHLKDAELRDFPLTLVVGSTEDRYEDDHDAGIYRIYLRVWDEKKFAVGVMRLAIEGMINTQRRDHLVWEILTRANAIMPVNAADARASQARDAHRTLFCLPDDPDAAALTRPPAGDQSLSRATCAEGLSPGLGSGTSVAAHQY